MKKIAFIGLVIVLALSAMAGGALAEENGSGLLAVENIFFYESLEGDGNPEQTKAANQTYRTRIAGMVDQSGASHCCETLRFDFKETLAVDDFTALTWQVTNTGDTLVYVRSDEFMVTFSGIEYDVIGGYRWANFAIQPGETLDARLHGALWSHFEPGEGQFELSYKIYALSEDAYAEAKESGMLDNLYPEESALTLLEETAVTVPVTMGKSETISALEDGKPIVREMNGYTLRITQADMNAVSAMFALERVYPTEEAARSDPSNGDAYWDYDFLAADGSVWIKKAYGSIPDDPVELEDGTWAWRYSHKVYYMFAQPSEIVVRAKRYTGAAGYDEAANEDVVLSFIPVSETN